MVDQGSARSSLHEELPGKPKTHCSTKREKAMSFERELNVDFLLKRKIY